MRLFFVLCAAAALASGQADRIEGERIRPHVIFLSCDLLEGRGPGTRGGLLTQAYIAAQFAAAGLKPAGDGGTFVQKVPLKLVAPEGDKAHLSFSVGGRDLELKWLDDFIGTTHQQQSNVDFEAEAVFVGHYEPDDRVACLQALVDAGVRVKLFGGTTWTPQVLGPLAQYFGKVEAVLGLEYAKALCGAQMCLCFISKLNRDTYTTRCFEIPACGRLMLSERTADLPRLFQEDQEAVCSRGHH